MAWLALPRRGVCIKALVAELRVTDANLFVVGLEVGVILAGCALGWYVYTGEAARVALLAHFPKRVDHCSVRAFVYAGVVVQQVILDKVVDVAGQTIVFTVPGTAQAFQIARFACSCC